MIKIKTDDISMWNQLTTIESDKNRIAILFPCREMDDVKALKSLIEIAQKELYKECRNRQKLGGKMMTNTYFVGPGGSDENTGETWETRKLTLRGIEEVAKEGDEVHTSPIEQSTYFEEWEKRDKKLKGIEESEINEVNYKALYGEVESVVRGYREDKELWEVWPSPPALHCVFFAGTESIDEVPETMLLKFIAAQISSGKTIDAHLRTFKEYSRNNSRDIDTLDEVADCLMMLTSAMLLKKGEIEYVPHPLPVYVLNAGPFALQLYIANLISSLALELYTNHPHATYKMINFPITACLRLLGDDASTRVRKRLERIREKHMS